MIHALYVDPFGPYPKLLSAAQCWDQKRDALGYEGPDPVVAHPPCGPWGWLRRNFKGGEQAKQHGRFAVDCVQRYGGVLEQPESSAVAYQHCGKMHLTVRSKLGKVSGQ